MNQTNIRLLYVGALAMSLGLTSCRDNSWDLSEDNIDLTVGSNVDLKLPGCSTGTIQLKNIIDLEEDGVVQLVPDPNGGDDFYVVREKGQADIDPIQIDKVEIKKPEIDDFQTRADLSGLFGGSSAKGQKNVKKIQINLGGAVLPLPNTSYVYNIKEGEASQRVQGAKAENMSEDILEIRDVKFDETTITLNFSISGFPKHVPYMHLDNMALNLPEELHVSSCQLNGVDAVSISNGKIQLTQPVDPARSTSDPLVLKLSLDGAKMGENVKFDGLKHCAEIKGDFNITGSFRIETSEMDEDIINTLVNAQMATWDLATKTEFMTTMNLRMVDGIIPDYLDFRGETCFDKDIRITHVSGKFQHAIGSIDPIKLDDLPDFLNDDDVVLDLDNPMLFINTTSSLPAVAKTKANLISRYSSGSELRAVDLDLKQGAVTYWSANDKNKTSFMPKEYADKSKNLQWLQMKNAAGQNADLSGLIKRIPKEIEIEVSDVTLDIENFDITKSYPIELGYEIYAPLAFGKDFYLVYQDTEDEMGLEDTFDDIDLGTLSINIEADVTSTLPAGFALKVEPLNKYGEIIKTLEPISIDVPVLQSGKSKKISLPLKPTSGHVLNESLNELWNGHENANQLDGIHYKAEILNPSVGEVLTGKGSIKLDNIKISVKGKVSYDANDN